MLRPMGWLTNWWDHEVVGGHKGPLLLAFVAFVVTFLATRTITRLIRAGRGPFHNMSSGGVHLHHSTPGTILLVTGAFGHSRYREIVLGGVTCLLLDLAPLPVLLAH